MKSLSLQERENIFAELVFYKSDCQGSPYPKDNISDKDKHSALDSFNIPRIIFEGSDFNKVNNKYE